MTTRRAVLVAIVALAIVQIVARVEGKRQSRHGKEEKTSDQSLLSLRAHKGWVSSLAFSPDGKRIASGGDDGAVKTWDATSGNAVMAIRGDSAITCVAYSADGKRIASGNWDKTVKVWDAQSGKELLTLSGHKESITCVAFSPDGKRIASGSGDDTLKVWDSGSGKVLLTIELDDDYDFTSLAFSPDGKRIVSGDGEKRVTVWDSQSGKELLNMDGHEAAVSCVAFSADGKRIVSGSWDKTLKVWDAKSGKELLTLSGHKESITCVAVSPDGKRITSGSEDDTLKVWDAQSGKELLTRRHPDKVLSVAFSPDGKRIASGSKGILKVWADRPSEAKTPSFDTDVGPFLKKHCLGCHEAKKQSSGIRLDRVERYRSEEGPLWTKVHEALSSKSMPPESRPQPSDAERKRILAWIEKEQLSAGAASLRRLNRRELSAALQDVTGLSVEYDHALPGDGKLGGFDTGADALQDSADSVTEAMKVTRRAVDGIRFLEPAPDKALVANLRGAKDPRKALDAWKDRGATFKSRWGAQPGKGLLLEPRWVGERDVHSITLPASRDGHGVLRLKLVVSVMKPIAEVPNPRLWVGISGRDVAFAEISGSLDKPQELVYEVQLDDLAIDSKGIRLSLSNKVEIPYSVKGYENEEVNRKGEDIPGGTGWFRPAFDRKLAPEKQPAPFIVLQRIEIDLNHVAAWPPAHWKLHLDPIGDNLKSAKQLLALWIERAWRRPASEKEQEKFLALYQKLREKKLSFDDALRATFQSVLLSGPFRYLASAVDKDAAVAKHAAASRLSFLLWGAPPDAELLELATEGKLRDAAVLDKQVDRLLADPRSEAFYRPFTLQWLEMEQPITIASSNLKKQDFRFARYLKWSMREETIAYLALLFADNKPVKELISSDWTMMNDSLAIHYGYKDVEGGHLRKVTLGKDDPRGGGVFGHAGIQSMLCWMGGNWVIYRGAWAMRHVLDDPPPPPPLEVPELNPADKANHGKTFKELLKKHQEDTNCAVCHKKMDPLGFAFQNFDLSGRWRDKEFDSYALSDLDGRIAWRGVGKSRAVDTVGKLPRGEKFTTFAECKQLIVKNYQADVVRGLMKNLVIYSTGRLPDVHDLAEIRRIMRQHEAKGYPLRDVLKALLRSKVFLER